MPQRHLPEWGEEDERAFEHRGSLISITTRCQPLSTDLQETTINNALESSVAESDVILVYHGLDLNCRSVQMLARPPFPTLADAAVTSSGTCHCSPEWHNFPLYIIRIQIAIFNFGHKTDPVLEYCCCIPSLSNYFAWQLICEH